jgi:xanthine dehydrogenase accessory factor
MSELYEEIAKITARGEEAAIATVVSTSGSTPREVGAKMLVRADGSIVGSIGGGSLEAQIVEQAVRVIKQGQPQQFHSSLTGEDDPDMICGGDIDIFIEPILPPSTLYIFGGGHVSLPLAKIGKLMGFKIAVIDDRAEFVNPRRFPEADLILAEDFKAAFPKLKINKSSYIVIVTRQHQFDELVLGLALKSEARYIGMMASRTRGKTVFSHLLEQGIPEEQLGKVHTPIGLEISARTPEEIALSIMAEVVKVRRSPV